MARRAAVSIDYPFRPPPPPGESMLFSTVIQGTYTGAEFYAPIAQFQISPSGTAVPPSNGAYFCARGGVLKSLYVFLDSNSTGTGTTVTIMVNSGASSLALVLPTGSLSGSDLSDVVTVNDEDTFSINVVSDTDLSKLQVALELIVNA